MGEKKTFEKALKDLENIVRQMESGQLSLEQAVDQYEKGMKQAKYCMDMLDKIEKKITILTKDSQGNIKKGIFEDDSDKV